MENEWIKALMQCAEGLYVLEEESRRVVWMSDYLTDGLDADGVGKPCWQVFMGRESPCPYCPRLSEGDGVYVWDFFEPKGKRWMKVKHLLFRCHGVLYRAGNINMMDDVMRLNYETVQEISMLQTVLKKNVGEMVKLEKEAIYDTLTGLYNRNCFHLDLKREYRDTQGIGVLYFDLNNLKETNDLYRHETGDALLRRLAEVLNRVSGHRKGSKCYRIGGDEFVLMITGGTEPELARLQELFADYMNAYNQKETYQCSIAVGCAFSEKSCDPEALVSRADSDMYRKKQLMKGIKTT